MKFQCVIRNESVHIVDDEHQPGDYDEVVHRANAFDDLVRILTGLTNVLNIDKDGDFFICAEASGLVADANALVARYS